MKQITKTWKFNTCIDYEGMLDHIQNLVRFGFTAKTEKSNLIFEGKIRIVFEKNTEEMKFLIDSI